MLPAKSFEIAEALRAEVAEATVFSGLDPRVSFAPWSLTVAEWPLARIVCHNTEQVASAMRVASERNVPVTVCGGREDGWGRNSRRDALVLDLSQMTKVHFNEQQATVEIGSGVTTGILLETLSSDTVLPTTANKNVGVIGAAMGGGYGMLCGSYGLTCDALLSADLVLSNGDLVHVSSDENADLLRALRGGGSGYGVVTSAQFSTHHCAQVLAANITTPLNASFPALLLIQELLDEHPVQLNLLPLFTKMPDESIQLLISFVWNGPEQEGRKVLASFRKLKNTTFQNEGCVPYRETLDDGAIWPWGKYWAIDTRTLSRLTPEIDQVLIEAAEKMPFPGNVLFLHDFHGHALNEPKAGSAFPLRQNHFVLFAAGSWDRNDEPALAHQQRSWIDFVSSKVTPFALPGGYINFLAPEDQMRATEGYGDAASSLKSLKRKYDPQDLLRYATGRLV